MIHRAVWVMVAALTAGCGKLHYVSPELASTNDPKAVHVLFPFYTHSGYHRIDHLNLERINDVDMRGYAAAIVPPGTYRFTYDCQMDYNGETLVRAEDRVKTLTLQPGHSYLLRPIPHPERDNPSDCGLAVRFCQPGQRIEKHAESSLKDSWSCRSG